MTRKTFDEIMARVDELNQSTEDNAGIINSLADGEDISEYTDLNEAQLEEICEKNDKELKEIFKRLRLKFEGGLELLSSSTVNRYEFYVKFLQVNNIMIGEVR